jgi:hypothetical protein
VGLTTPHSCECFEFCSDDLVEHHRDPNSYKRTEGLDGSWTVSCNDEYQAKPTAPTFLLNFPFDGTDQGRYLHESKGVDDIRSLHYVLSSLPSHNVET